MSREVGRPKFHSQTAILTVSVEASLVEKLTAIAHREGKSRSAIIEPLLEDYVKAHGNGNDTTPLDAFDGHPEVKAFPTPWKRLGRNDLESYAPEELAEMERSLRANTDTIHYLQQHPTASKSTGQAR